MTGFSFRRAAQTAALAAITLLTATASQVSAAPEGARWGPKYFPDYEVIAHTGEHFRFYHDLVEEKIVVFNFIYTRCTDLCPLQNARMAQLYELLQDRMGKDIFFYSVSMEPEVDTPEVMASMAEAFGVGPGWMFLTGDPEELHEIRFKLGERSRTLSEHGNGLMLGNDHTAEWERSSLMTDLPLLANKIRSMDPAVRDTVRDTTTSRHMAGKSLQMPDGQALYMKACVGCHNIGGGDKVGPDLHGLTARRDRDWLNAFMSGPDLMLGRGDPIAKALDARFPVAKMPNLGLSPDDIDDLLSFIDLRTGEYDQEHASGEASPPPAGAAPAADGATPKRTDQ